MTTTLRRPPSRLRAGRPLLLVAGGIIAVLVVVGVTALRHHSTTHHILGTVQLRQNRDAPGACAGTGALSSVHQGAPVVITDNEGAVIATSTLGPGSTGATFGEDTVLTCSFAFTARNVPDEAIVRIAVADRTAIPFTRWQLHRSDWHAVLTVGS